MLSEFSPRAAPYHFLPSLPNMLLHRNKRFVNWTNLVAASTKMTICCICDTSQLCMFQLSELINLHENCQWALVHVLSSQMLFVLQCCNVLFLRLNLCFHLLLVAFIVAAVHSQAYLKEKELLHLSASKNNPCFGGKNSSIFSVCRAVSVTDAVLSGARASAKDRVCCLIL